jgi:predicted ATPase
VRAFCTRLLLEGAPLPVTQLRLDGLISATHHLVIDDFSQPSESNNGTLSFRYLSCNSMMAQTMNRKKANKKTDTSAPNLQLRWRNFRSFEDTDWFELRPVTIVLGANNSGKTNLVRPLLLLKQTLDSGDEDIALKLTGPLADVGTYRNVVFGRKTNRKVELSLRFHPLEKNVEKKKLKSIGTYPPSEVRLEFGMGRDPLEVVLQRFEVLDNYGRSCLVRKRTRSGSYSLSTALTMSSPLRKIAKTVTPSHFTFSGFGMVRRLFEEQEREFRRRTKGKKTKVRRTLTLQLKGMESDYFGVLSSVESHVSRIFSSLNYIGPLREYPKRFYESTEEVPEAVGVRGELAPHILYLTKEERLAPKTNGWLKTFGLARKVSCDEFHDDLFALKVTDLHGDSSVDYSDSGFGLSQLLPLIVQGFHSDRKEILFFEQPEIHLNPKLQCQLANLFAEMSASEKTVIVETHSEHLVLRIRTLIATGKLRPENVALYYVEKEGVSSVLRKIPISEDGHIEPNQWPVGFFEESLGEVLRLARVPKSKGGRQRVD